jgi:esterase/lipase superfamily enzyme
MEALFEQLKVYLNMDTEISYEEFDAYYKKVLEFLNGEWKNLDQDQTMKMLFIVDSIKSNAEDRFKRKLKEAKKYKKIAERTHIWTQALFNRLREMGWSEEEIAKRFDEIYEAV